MHRYREPKQVKLMEQLERARIDFVFNSDGFAQRDLRDLKAAVPTPHSGKGEKRIQLRMEQLHLAGREKRRAAQSFISDRPPFPRGELITNSSQVGLLTYRRTHFDVGSDLPPSPV
jgi:hypothetical protein